MIKKITPFFLICLSFIYSNAQEKTNPANQDEELGGVSWYRDFEVASALSKTQNKPILILFQEVPGCSTCRNYGKNVLTHPLMVEAIENEFIPLAIFNNKGGKDRQILQIYNELSWNNPVVRIVDQDGKNLVERIAGNYSIQALYNGMLQALKVKNKPVPEYIKLLGEEFTALYNKNVEDKYFKMYCFWTGEKQLGSNHGVLNTEAGFMKGHEVVKVTYNRDEISESKLNGFAKNHNFTPITNDNSYRAATKDEDYYLQHSVYKYLPLSKLQRTKINSDLGKGKSAEKYLSPKQLRWLQELMASKIKKETRFNKPITETWTQLSLH